MESRATAKIKIKTTNEIIRTIKVYGKCLHCGYSLHSDLNASNNLSQLYIRNMGLADCNIAIDLACDDDKASSISDDELRLSIVKSPHL